ncbi:MAG: hypothetical protein LUC85_03950 [Bacteroidales bacterium]|nr:hypothetical protein [Bacteroidales bacterium]
MPKAVNWKKGMRLTTEVFLLDDMAKHNAIRQAALIASRGSMGLYRAPKPFQLSVNIANNSLEVVALNCHGITRGGALVDIDFQGDYTHTFETTVPLPHDAPEGETYLLVVKVDPGKWRELSEQEAEQMYTFELMGANSPIDDFSLPIGSLVNQYGWHINDVSYCPPCLYVCAHPMHVEQLSKARARMHEIATRCSQASNCIARSWLSIVWPTVWGIDIRLDKDRDILTPSQLLAELQQFVAAFLAGCAIDPMIHLEDSTSFEQFAALAYDPRNAYTAIQQGLALCAEIAVKVDAVCGLVEEAPSPAPQPKPEPKPKPQPKIEDDPRKRRRWEGMEI